LEVAARFGKSFAWSNLLALIAIPGLEVFRVQVGGKCFEDNNNFMVLDHSW
jgi:hypothetical protein